MEDAKLMTVGGGKYGTSFDVPLLVFHNVEKISGKKGGKNRKLEKVKNNACVF